MGGGLSKDDVFGMYGGGLGGGFMVVYCGGVSMGLCVKVETWILV